ncbi:L-rhamnose-binding lectin CSL1-like [Alosa alosa]|uniref:L-rhamnose-binding lectin CSL1-like n=1 Tax=Alosa alosa TaxID=278164 RepID=UPI00201541D4|nr:L-rhamnose-binding lectin CSL1-like [Alosa alosa]
MQGQTFIALISLIVLYHNGIEASGQVCEGTTVQLSCGLGFIKVNWASYGRSNRDTCSSGRPPSQLSNTKCHQHKSLRIMSDRCNGMSSCAVPVKNSVFYDPCPGTYKYLDLSYTCHSVKRSVTCENNQNAISCAKGSLFIHHANYGRRDRLTCPHKLAKTSHCYHSQTDNLHGRCNGKKSCQLHASNAVFSDPCHGVNKYLEVTYSCTQSSLIVLCHNGIEGKRYAECEGETGHLSCGWGFIKVISASYGRSNRDTCSSGRPPSQLSNPQCHQHQSLRIMSDRCNGMSSCAVPVTNSVFSDPCVGTYKYLDISYTCHPAKRSVTCEHNQNVISCDTGSLFIHHANYGRRDLLTCPHEHATTPNCYHSQTDYLRGRCHGKTSCQLNASNTVFSDPCRGVNKYLEVTHSCTPS